ncbi:MAG: ribbon-helix-helix domain-containing protein [Rhizobiaceae bacterium]
MNIPLKKRYQDWIAEQVSAGRYSSEIEAIEEALREQMERDEANRLWERIQESERQIERGEYVVADDAFFERKRQMIRDRYMKPEK